jgi:cytochrome c oxidase assembly protein subunit 15
MTSPHRQFHRLAWLAVLLALGVIVFGAFVRLSNAGLSCPDWPTCYGRATWPQHDEAVDHAATAIRAVESHKAWREQFHRHIAATLGLMVLGLAVLAARARRHGLATVLGASALVAISIPLYMRQHYTEAAVLAGVAEALLLMAAWRWSNTDFARVATLTLAVIIFQAMLGMWTVTWLLKPVVVMAHLVGGLTTFSLLVWMACRATECPIRCTQVRPKLRRLLIIGLLWSASRSRSAAGSRPTTRRWPAARISRSASGQWWPPPTSAKASCYGAGSASTTKAACSTTRHASRSSWRIA